MSPSADPHPRSPLAALRRRGGVPLTVARGVKRGAVATQRHAEELADPVLRPVIATVARLRGGPTAEEFLDHLRAGRHITCHRWGRLGWTAPRRRAVIPIDDRRHVPRTPARLLRQGRFEVTTDKAFADVLHHCATVQGRTTCGRPWLVPQVREVYMTLHETGHAHSIEVWRDGELVGGELGVAIGGFYSGDSVFFLESNAGKVALAWLTGHLQERGFVLLDTLMVTPMSRQFGAYRVPRAEYRARLREALAADVTFS
ncbi:leucyl/phenylalanyl-tRNA--protein transferase [Pseudonocardia sp.]|uniref:leucyl/phenylalanyl-tRNA--protein transferase n=1 Tax=Pseudonocardia sp. TaxID=60912 RepID=UPI00262C92A6|nr:leucyl/phenylalanyl-tRNA--protein transferase [Pseudonocardia sp.]